MHQQSPTSGPTQAAQRQHAVPGAAALDPVRERLGRRRRAPKARHRAVDVLAAAAGLGLGVTVGLDVLAETGRSLAAAGGWTIAAGRMAGMVGTYLLLLAVVLVARLPWLERVAGQDRLVRWHRRVAPWMLVLLVAHAGLITVGYMQAAHSSLPGEAWKILSSMPGMITATVALLLLVAAGVTSVRIARARMQYETWWIVHLYTYLAIALSYSHQLAAGTPFVGHPFARAYWIALWIGTAGAVLAWRVALPAWRSVRHGVRVVAVHEEGPGVVSIICSGRRLDRLPVSGGQFLQWRFLAREMWWQAHPYSLSAVPTATHMRVTVKDLGDHSSALRRLRPGTRVAIEGPYGALTADARTHDRVVLVGAGVGNTPLRAILDDLPWDVRVDVILRASTPAELVLRDEIAAHVAQRGGRLHELVGSRQQVRLGPAELHFLVPDIAWCDVYVCGPDGFMRGVLAAARRLHVPETQLHHEDYAF